MTAGTSGHSSGGRVPGELVSKQTARCPRLLSHVRSSLSLFLAVPPRPLRLVLVARCSCSLLREALPDHSLWPRPRLLGWYVCVCVPSWNVSRRGPGAVWSARHPIPLRSRREKAVALLRRLSRVRTQARLCLRGGGGRGGPEPEPGDPGGSRPGPPGRRGRGWGWGGAASCQPGCCCGDPGALPPRRAAGRVTRGPLVAPQARAGGPWAPRRVRRQPSRPLSLSAPLC